MCFIIRICQRACILKKSVRVGLSSPYTIFCIPGANRNRTCDFLLAKQALSQLSYSPVDKPLLKMGLDRFELSTPALSEQCSNQLSYRPRVYFFFAAGAGSKPAPRQRCPLKALMCVTGLCQSLVVDSCYDQYGFKILNPYKNR
jgi:hypothetical protein